MVVSGFMLSSYNLIVYLFYSLNLFILSSHNLQGAHIHLEITPLPLHPPLCTPLHPPLRTRKPYSALPGGRCQLAC